jgi:hypothetical protein
MWLRAGLLVVALVGCDGVEDGPSELTGRFNLRIETISGCDNDESLVGWMLGSLTVAGTQSAPTFDFGGDFVFDGATSPSGRFSFSGVVQDGDVEYAAFGSGSGSGASPSLTLTGSAGADVSSTGDPPLDCTINADYTAVQIAP